MLQKRKHLSPPSTQTATGCRSLLTRRLPPNEQETIELASHFRCAPLAYLPPNLGLLLRLPWWCRLYVKHQRIASEDHY